MTRCRFCDAPIRWAETTKAKYWEMLEILPPAVMTGIGFMVGEPFGHDASGYPRYDAFVEIDGRFYAALGPMTVKEFKALTPGAILANLVKVAR